VVPAIQAAAQLEQVAALVVVLKVEPATHAVHPVLAVTEHKVERRVPAAQTVQAEQVAALVTVLNVEPAMQLVHTLFVVTVHAVDA
jgi:hypothetical protein